MPFTIDQIIALADDLGSAPVKAILGSRTVVARGALNVKRQMQQEAAGIAHAPGLPADISYTTTVDATGISAEIGPTAGDVGSLALLYFGNSKTGPVVPDPLLAAEAEAPALQRFLEQVGVDSIG